MVILRWQLTRTPVSMLKLNPGCEAFGNGGFRLDFCLVCMERKTNKNIMAGFCVPLLAAPYIVMMNEQCVNGHKIFESMYNTPM